MLSKASIPVTHKLAISPGIFVSLIFLQSQKPASYWNVCIVSLIGKCHNLSALHVITLIPAEVDFNPYKNTTVQLMPNAKPIYIVVLSPTYLNFGDKLNRIQKGF